jgi:hypothetical protein
VCAREYSAFSRVLRPRVDAATLTPAASRCCLGDHGYAPPAMRAAIECSGCCDRVGRAREHRRVLDFLDAHPRHRTRAVERNSSPYPVLTSRVCEAAGSCAGVAISWTSELSLWNTSARMRSVV